MKAVESKLAGVYQITLDVFGDDRGSFREAYQAEKLAELGVPAIVPVQMNVSVSQRGVIRGVHAEPWEKYIHVTSGTVFAAIVDLREDSETFGQVVTFELGSGNALLLPRGVGNAFAVTSDAATYTYLVTEHWRPDLKYPAIAYDDPDLGINWPIPETERIISEKDRANRTLRETYPEKFA